MYFLKINKKEYKLKRKNNKNKKTHIKYIFYSLIIIFIIVLILLITKQIVKIDLDINRKIKFNNFSSNFTKNEEKIILNNESSTLDYFCCFCVMGRMENRYVRELISYYTSLGVDKFIIADNNLPNTEKFSDVLQDYINSGIVEIIDIIGQSYDYSQYYDIMYQKYKNKCEWLAFFDFDEYLVVYSDQEEKIKLKEFLSNSKFDKCEAIFFNWLIYNDNDLVYYDKRPSIERFTNANYNSPYNRFVKTMIRGNLNKTTFIPYKSCHKPNKEIKMCNAKGEIPDYNPDSLTPPLFKYGYLMHFSSRTAEEYVTKVKRGNAGNRHESYEERVYSFFLNNKVTEEKLKIFEKQFNQIFYRYHYK